MRTINAGSIVNATINHACTYVRTYVHTYSILFVTSDDRDVRLAGDRRLIARETIFIPSHLFFKNR
jgi:hypothetical protein